MDTLRGTKVWALAIGVLGAGLAPQRALAEFTVAPYAEISSTKAIKPPGKEKGTQEESLTQKTIYGLRGTLGLGHFFSLQAQVGYSKTDVTKKPVAIRDSFGQVDFENDADLQKDPEATFRSVEEMTQGQVRANIRMDFSLIDLHGGAGVRGSQRKMTLTDTAAGVSKTLNPPIAWHALGTAGVGVRLGMAMRWFLDYTFYFIKFPKTEPHEQAVSTGFSVRI